MALENKRVWKIRSLAGNSNCPYISVEYVEGGADTNSLWCHGTTFTIVRLMKTICREAIQTKRMTPNMIILWWCWKSDMAVYLHRQTILIVWICDVISLIAPFSGTCHFVDLSFSTVHCISFSSLQESNISMILLLIL